MCKMFIVGLLVSFFVGCKTQIEPVTIKNNVPLNYPETKKVDTIDNYFGENIKDPYRWLEDDRSESTEDWVKAQNKVTFGYLNEIPFKNKLKDRLSALWNYEKVSASHIFIRMMVCKINMFYTALKKKGMNQKFF